MNENLDWLKDVIVATNSGVSKNELVKNVTETYNQFQAMHKAYAEKLDECEALKADYDVAMSSIDAKDLIIQNLENSCKSMKGTCDNWEKMYQELTEEKENVSNQLEDVAEDWQSAIRELKTLKAANEKAEEDVLKANELERVAKAQATHFENELKKVRREKEEKEKEVEDARKTLEETQKMFEEAKKTNEQLVNYALKLQEAIKRQYEIGLILLTGPQNEPANG